MAITPRRPARAELRRADLPRVGRPGAHRPRAVLPERVRLHYSARSAPPRCPRPAAPETGVIAASAAVNSGIEGFDGQCGLVNAGRSYFPSRVRVDQRLRRLRSGRAGRRPPVTISPSRFTRPPSGTSASRTRAASFRIDPDADVARVMGGMRVVRGVLTSKRARDRNRVRLGGRQRAGCHACLRGPAAPARDHQRAAGLRGQRSAPAPLALPRGRSNRRRTGSTRAASAVCALAPSMSSGNAENHRPRPARCARRDRRGRRTRGCVQRDRFARPTWRCLPYMRR